MALIEETVKCEEIFGLNLSEEDILVCLFWASNA